MSGIIPPQVQAIVRKEAKRSVQKAQETIERGVVLPPVSAEQLIETVGPLTGVGRDLTILLAMGEVRRGQELKAEMARQQIAWQARYEYELQLEIERILQDAEDEQIVTLLFQRYMH